MGRSHSHTLKGRDILPFAAPPSAELVLPSARAAPFASKTAAASPLVVTIFRYFGGYFTMLLPVLLALLLVVLTVGAPPNDAP